MAADHEREVWNICHNKDEFAYIIDPTVVEGEETAYRYTADNNKVTFNGPLMKAALETLAGNPEKTENVDYGFVLRAEAYTDGHGTQEPIEVRDNWMHIHFDEEYLEDDEHDTMVIGERFYYTGGEALYWNRNAEHPMGERYTVTIRDIQVTDPDEDAKDTAYMAEQDEDGAWYLNAVREGEANIVYTLYHEDLGVFTVERTKWVRGSMYRLSLDTNIKRNVLMAGQSLDILEYVEKAIAQFEQDEDMGEVIIKDTIYEAVERYNGEKEAYSVSYYDFNSDLISIDENGRVTVNENVDWWDNTDVRVEVIIPMGENEDPVVLNQNINISIEPDYKVITADSVAVVPRTTLNIDDIGAALIHYNMYNEEQPESIVQEGVEFFFEYEGMEDWLIGSEDGKTLTVSEDVEIEEGSNRYTEVQLHAVYVTPQGYEEQWIDRWELTVCCPPNFEGVKQTLTLPEEGTFEDVAVWSSSDAGISNGTREDYYKITVTEGQEGYYIFRRNQGSMLQIWTEDGDIFYNPQQNWGGAELIGFFEAGIYYVRLVSEVEVPETGTNSLTLRLEHLEYLQFTQTGNGTREVGQNCSYLVELPYDGAFAFLLEHEETDNPLFLYVESLETGKAYGTYGGDISGEIYVAGTYIVQAGDSGEEGKESGVTSFSLRVKKDLAAAKISLSQDGFIYDESKKKPNVTVTGEDGTVLTEGKDYVVRYCREDENGEWVETEDFINVGTIAVQIDEVPEPTEVSEYVGSPGTANMQLYDILPQESVQEITTLPVPGEAVNVEIWNTSTTEGIQTGRREDVYKISVTEDVYYIFGRDQETVMQILDANGDVYFNPNADSGYKEIVKFAAPADGDADTYYIRLISEVWFPNEGEEEPIALNLWIERPNDFQLGKTEVCRREVHQLDNYLVTLPYDGNYAFVLKHGTAVQNLLLYVEGMDVEYVGYTYDGDLSGEFKAGTYLIQIGDIGDGTFSQVSAYDLGVKKDLLDTSIKLSETSFTYNGAEQYPEVVVTSTKETDESEAPIVLEEGHDYVVEYLRDGKITDDLISAGTITVQIHDNGNADSEYIGYPGSKNIVAYTINLPTEIQEITLPGSGESTEKITLWNSETNEAGRRTDIFKFVTTAENYYIFRRSRPSNLQILDEAGCVVYGLPENNMRYNDVIGFGAPQDGATSRTFYVCVISDVKSNDDGSANTFEFWMERPTDLTLGQAVDRNRTVGQVDSYLVYLPEDGDYSFILKHEDAEQNLYLYAEALESTYTNGTHSGIITEKLEAGPYIIQAADKGDGTVSEVTNYRIKAIRTCTEHIARKGSDIEFKAANCITTGTMQHVCDNCEEIFTSVIPKTGHTPGAWSVTKDSTCTAAGTKVQKCASGCGTIVATQTIAATGHKGGTATCTAKAKCTACGIEYGSLKAHTPVSTWKVVKAPTVLTTGTQTKNCSVCGTVVQSQSIAKLKGTLELPGNVKSLSIKKGKTVKFDITMTTGDTLTSCTSSNSTILKVVSSSKNGAISLKAVKKGSVNLTVKLASGTSKSYKITVTTGTVKTTKVVSSHTKLTLEKGKSQNLKATVTPFTSTQKVTYKTSNKKVAKVSASGKVTAVAPGTAKITLKSGSKSATCTVTVTGITNVKTSLTLNRNKSTTLKPKLYGITDKVTYTSSNTAIATVDSKGKITALKKKGTVTITVIAGKYSVKCKVKVK